MKTCGYCGRTYDDSEPRCPSCGSTFLKYSQGTDSAAADYDRIKKEVEEKRKIKNKIFLGVAAAAVVIVIIIISGIYSKANDPQRKIDADAKEMYESALDDYNKGQYDAALNTLNAIDPSWADYDKASELKQKTVSLILGERANDYMADGNYEEILRLITTNADNLNDDPELKNLYNTAAENYRNQIIYAAEKACSENGYQAALSTINEGLSVLKSDSILQAEQDKYASFEPVDLTSITPYYQGAIEVFTDGETDTMGNNYRTGIRGYMGESDAQNYECYDIWDIGGEYNKLTATGIVFESDKGSKNEGSYKIYGDGVLLYEKSNIGSQTKPYQIEVDITGVHDLKIEMYGEGNIGYCGIDSVLVDVMLQKTK